MKLRADRYLFEKIKLHQVEEPETQAASPDDTIEQRKSSAVAYAINKGKENVQPKYEVYSSLPREIDYSRERNDSKSRSPTKP